MAFDYASFVGLINSFKPNIDEDKLSTDAEEEALHSFNPNAKAKAASAVFVAVVFAVIALAPIDLLMKVFWAVFFSLVYLISAIDLRTRMIPFEICGVLLVLGITYQLIFFGWITLVLVLGIGIIVYVAFRFVEFIFSKLGNLGSIGGGDMRLIAPVVITCGMPGAIYGAVAMVVALLVVNVGGGLIKKVTRKTKLPLGPFFGIWLMVGLILPVAVG